MTGQDLKNSILQLAIQGKLVPQDANDEPASVLLERIKAEKQKLIKEKKIKKEKPLPEITEEEKPFEIPESWEWCRFGEIILNRDSERIPLSVEVRSKQKNKIYDYYGPGGAFDKVEHYLFDKRLLLIGEDGANLLTRSKPNAFFAEGKYWVNNHVHVLDSYIEDDIILDYIAMRINGMSLADYVTGTAQPKMNQEKMNSILIPLPPLSEQHRIVAKIEELMPLVEEYDKAQKELDALNAKLPEALKKSILQEAIQGKLVPQDPNDEPASVLLQRIRKEKEQLVKDGKLKKKDLVTTPITDEEKPFEIPENWEWCRLGDISNSYIGLTYKPSDVSENGTVVLRSSNIQNGKLSLLDIVKVSFDIPEKLRVRESDILICARNGSQKLVGKSALVTKEAEGMTFGAFMAICKTLFYAYVFRFLQSDLFFSQLREVSGTTTINQLTQKNFNNFLIPLPPLAEQHRIVSKIEDLFAQIEPLAKALSTPM